MKDEVVIKRIAGKELTQSWKDTILAKVPNVKPLAVFIANQAALKSNDMKGEWLTFPTKRETVQGVLERQEMLDSTECICVAMTSSIHGLAEKIDPKVDLDVLNTIAEGIQLLEKSPRDIAILEACLEVYPVKNGIDIINMILNTERYQLVQDKAGMQAMANTYQDQLQVPKSISGMIHIDMQGVQQPPRPKGQAFMTKRGFLERLSRPKAYYKTKENIPDKFRVIPTKSIQSVLEEKKQEQLPQDSSKSVKKDRER